MSNTLWRFVPTEADAFHAEQDELHEARQARQARLAEIEQCRKIVEDKQCAVVGGKMMDMQTASVIVQIYDGLNPNNQRIMANCSSINEMAIMAWKLADRLKRN